MSLHRLLSDDLPIGDEEQSHAALVSMRWPNEVTCPCCSSPKLYHIPTRRTWACKITAKQFSVKTGTVMMNSPLTASQWLFVLSYVAKGEVNSYRLARLLNISQKSAWFAVQRAVIAVAQDSLERKA